MSSIFALAHSSCLHMSVPTLSSCSSISSTFQTTLPINKHCEDPQNEECGPVANTNSSTGYEPNVIDNFDYSETYTAIFQNESVDIDTEPSYSFDAELDDELIRKALSSELFILEREESANLRQTYHSHEESLSPAQSFFHTNKYGETRVRTKFKFVSKTEIKSRPGKQANQDSPWKKKKEQILAEVRSEIQKHELEADSGRRSIQELTGIIDSQRMEIDHTITRCEQSRRDQLLLQEEISAQSGSSWNLYQEYARHGRIAEKSRVKGRGTFKKKIGWRLWGSNFFLPGLECQESQHPWRQRSTQMLRLTTSTRNSLASPLYLQERESSASLLHAYHAKEKVCFKVHSQF